MAEYGKKITANDLKKCSTTDLIARTIYGEARGESNDGKRGVAWVIRNRLTINKPKEFGSNYKEIVLNTANRFDGLYSPAGLAPDTSSKAWKECLDIAKRIKTMQTYENPIDHCLWFNASWLYDKVIKENNGKYKFGGGKPVKVVNHRVIGKQTFFLVEGYTFNIK